MNAKVIGQERVMQTVNTSHKHVAFSESSLRGKLDILPGDVRTSARLLRLSSIVAFVSNKPHGIRCRY
jgi:hypothetical protein